MRKFRSSLLLLASVAVASSLLLLICNLLLVTKNNNSNIGSDSDSDSNDVNSGFAAGEEDASSVARVENLPDDFEVVGWGREVDRAVETYLRPREETALVAPNNLAGTKTLQSFFSCCSIGGIFFSRAY